MSELRKEEYRLEGMEEVIVWVLEGARAARRIWGPLLREELVVGGFLRILKA